VAGTLGERETARFGPLPPTLQVSGEIAAMALYADESVDAVTQIRSPGDIVAELTANTLSIPRRPYRFADIDPASTVCGTLAIIRCSQRG
jgi:hypothetical protein